MDKLTYDVIVIGAGSTGENVADRAVKGGLTAVILESDLVGGDCSYRACMPSKALLRPGTALEHARSLMGAREAVTGKVHAQAVFARRDSFASNWDDAGHVKWLREAEIDLLRGHGRLMGQLRVSVTGMDGGTTNLTARHAVAVCTGSRPAIPDIPGLAEATPWTSRESTSAKSIPRRLVILGGGAVACEMATAWKQLGSEEVTVIERGACLIPKCELFAGKFLRAAFEERGITVLTDTTVKRVYRQQDGVAGIVLSSGPTLLADEILVAAGRLPRTDELGLQTVGLKPGSWMETDDSLLVKNVAGGWLYAAGDVNHRALLTHMGKYQARVCGDVIAARARGDADASGPEPWSRYSATADHQAVPQVIFADPEVAAVGLTEAQAKALGMNVRAVDYDIARVAGASLYADGYKGKARAVVDHERGVLVGMTLVGPAVGELIHAATIAIVGGIPISRLWHAVPRTQPSARFGCDYWKLSVYESVPETRLGVRPQPRSQSTGLMTMEEEEIRETLIKHWRASAAGDADAEHAIYDEDAICDYPQSGERILGRSNLQALRSHHPDKPAGFNVKRILGERELWITEYTINYEQRSVFTVSIMEFCNGKVIHETQYFADPFDAPPWRSQWIQRTS